MDHVGDSAPSFQDEEKERLIPLSTLQLYNLGVAFFALGLIMGAVVWGWLAVISFVGIAAVVAACSRNEKF